MGRYNVWHTTGKADGDSSWDDYNDALEEFYHQTKRAGISEVELTDNDNPDNPISLFYWDAVDGVRLQS